MKNFNILWISAYVPYDKVRHAGGKTHNYYLKKLCEKHSDVFLLTFSRKKELEKIDLDEYKIPYELIVLKTNFRNKLERALGIMNAKYNALHKYGGILRGYYERPLKKKILKLYNKGIKPKIIILEWTEVVLLVPYIKKLFPESKIISIEEDVSFLGIYRKILYTKNILQKKILSVHYNKLKKLELEALECSDVVILNNYKDKKLIEKEGVKSKKIFLWAPFFENMCHLQYKAKKNRIIFYGAMDRKENYLSVIWFIEKVMPLIADLDIVFEVVGNNPAPLLEKYKNNKVNILGYVDDIGKLFSESLCLVAPLVLGAGIKVKILEAFSSGLPVLTNSIGIEGISAVNKRDFFYCEMPEDYADTIRKIVQGKYDCQKISNSAQNFIKENYDLEKDANRFIDLIDSLVSN